MTDKFPYTFLTGASYADFSYMQLLVRVIQPLISSLIHDLFCDQKTIQTLCKTLLVNYA